MALTTSTITGRVPLPTDETLQYAELTFTLSGLDTEGADVLPGGISKRVVLIDSDIPPGFELWQNTAGLRGTHYPVLARWTTKDRDGVRDQYADLGVIQIGSDASYPLADLLNSSVPQAVGTFWSAITQAQYDAAIDAADRAETVAGMSRADAVVKTAGGWVPTADVTYHFDGLEYLGKTGSTAIPDLPGLVAVDPSVVAVYGGDTSGSFTTAFSKGIPLDFGTKTYASDDATYYFNLYGATRYPAASYKQLRHGKKLSPVNDPQPVVAVHKFSSANRDIDAAAWDQAGYYSIQSYSGDAYRAALTGFTRAMSGATGDHIGLHGRTDVRDPDARGYGLWAYGADLNETTSAAACHAAELNGQCLLDPGYGSDHQLLRLAMADSAISGNRYGSAITIGNPTHGGAAGFHAGLWVQPNSVLGSVVADGEAVRIDSRTNNLTGTTGGIRFTRSLVTHTGLFKYALKTEEAYFENSRAIVMRSTQRIDWRHGGLDASYLTGGSNNLVLGGGFLQVLNPVSDTVMQAAGIKVLGERKTGWGNFGGTATRTTFTTSTVTLEQLAERMKALIDDLKTHGLIGT